MIYAICHRCGVALAGKSCPEHGELCSAHDIPLVSVTVNGSTFGVCPECEGGKMYIEIAKGQRP